MRFIFGIVFTLVALGIAGLVYMYTGSYDVAASTPHNPFVRWVLETTMENSVAAHAKAGVPAEPKGLDLAARGAAIYADDCAGCHGAPGQKPMAFAKGMLPDPPDLAKAEADWTPAELFWIVKHGIKMSGMPAWGAAHSDADLWAVVAFLRDLPTVMPERYRTLSHAPAGAPAPAPAPEPAPAPSGK